MRFVREIPENNIIEKTINDLSQQGFTIVWKEDSIEIWADC